MVLRPIDVDGVRRSHHVASTPSCLTLAAAVELACTVAVGDPSLRVRVDEWFGDLALWRTMAAWLVDGKRPPVAADCAGVAEIHWHSLRHSFASQLVSAGVPLPQVQAWLGHSTIAMTERYAHLAPGGNSAILALDGHVVDTPSSSPATTGPPSSFSVRATGFEPVAPAV